MGSDSPVSASKVIRFCDSPTIGLRNDLANVNINLDMTVESNVIKKLNCKIALILYYFSLIYYPINATCVEKWIIKLNGVKNVSSMCQI